MPVSVLYDLKKRKTRYRVLSADSVGDLSTIESMPSGFVLLLVDRHWSEHKDDALAVAYDLLRKGLRCAVTWADGEAEGLHDLIDKAIVEGSFETGNSSIMTTWHDKEPLSKAVWYSLVCGIPSKPYDITCRNWIAAVVGDDALARDVIMALQQTIGLFPKGFKAVPA